MKNSSHNLSFGANLGFAHMFCSECGEQRLHRHCTCVSCQTVHPTSRYKPRDWQPHSPVALNPHQRKALTIKEKDRA